jgi:cobalt-zinc-cadmium efflux system outer membrane protein
MTTLVLVERRMPGAQHDPAKRCHPCGGATRFDGGPRRVVRHRDGGVLSLIIFVIGVSGLRSPASAQTVLTWPEVRARLQATNPTLQADQIWIDELKAAEITAFLRPNPQLSGTLDQIGHTQLASGVAGGLFDASNPIVGISYLHERQQKRELRRDGAHAATSIALSAHADLERTLAFTLRTAFVQVLQAKAFLVLAQTNLTAYDQALALSRDRFQAGDIAQIDLDRLELQRVTYESDMQTAQVNLRVAKIQLLRFLNDHTTSVDRFDVTGRYDFTFPSQTLGELRRIALDTRPDLRAALAGIEKARIDHRLAIANGSTDPVITVDAGFPALSQAWLSYNPPLRQYVGVGVAVPLRFFDRNQGEKLRTQLDIGRNEKLVDAARLQVFGDVDTAYATVMSAVALLQPYKDRYLDQATRVRETVTFSYQRGGASLLDFLQAQQEYRAVQVSYVNLLAAFLNAVNQLNVAVGQEVIQ